MYGGGSMSVLLYVCCYNTSSLFVWASIIISSLLLPYSQVEVAE